MGRPRDGRSEKQLPVRITADFHYRLKQAARFLKVSQSDLFRIGIAHIVEEIEESRIRLERKRSDRWRHRPADPRELAAWRRDYLGIYAVASDKAPGPSRVFRRKADANAETASATAAAAAPEPKSTASPEAPSLALLAGYVEASGDSTTADRRLARVLEIIAEGAETAEEAEEMARQLEQRAKRRTPRSTPAPRWPRS